MIPISTWYSSLGCYTFPTVFVRLTTAQIAALVAGEREGDAVAAVTERLALAISRLPGACVVHADVCAPTDTPGYREEPAVRSGEGAWTMLVGSDKVKTAFREGKTERLGLRPYRRMDVVREFRLFVYGRQLRAMSQMRLDRHYRRLAGRQEFLWAAARQLTEAMAPFLPADDLAIDVYLTSSAELMVVDMNGWGDPTDPLLLRTWEQDWQATPGLKLIPPPIKLRGNVEVSF